MGGITSDEMISGRVLQASELYQGSDHLNTLLDRREPVFTATPPLIKTGGDFGAEAFLAIDETASVVANAFVSGTYRFRSPNAGGCVIERYDDGVGGWRLVVAFEWSDAAGEGRVLTNTIQSYSATDVTINDSLQVTEGISCLGALTAGSVESVAVDTTRVAAIDSVGIALCTQAYSVAFSVQDNQDCTAHRNLTVVGDLTVNGDISGSIQSPYWCAGALSNTGEKLSSRGRHSYSVSQVASGLWEITFPEHPDATPICLIGAINPAPNCYMAGHATSTSFQAYHRTYQFGITNSNWNFVVLA